MQVTEELTIEKIVAEDDSFIAVFESLGIDFNSKANRTISEVCETRNINVIELLEDLEEVIKVNNSKKTIKNKIKPKTLMIKKRIHYESSCAAINDLIKRGYTANLPLLSDGEHVMCEGASKQFNPSEFTIDEVYRFDGGSDQSDETIIYAISSTKYHLKGILVNAFGTYFDEKRNKLVEKLKLNF